MARTPKAPEWTGMPNSEEKIKDIKISITATHPSFSAIDNEKENIKMIFDELHAKYGIPRRVFNKLAKFSYYGNAEAQFEKDDEIKDAWMVINDMR